MNRSESLKKYLDVSLGDRNIIGSSSEIFGNLWKFSEMFENDCLAFENLWKVFGNLCKIVKKVVINMFI